MPAAFKMNAEDLRLADNSGLLVDASGSLLINTGFHLERVGGVVRLAPAALSTHLSGGGPDPIDVATGATFDWSGAHVFAVPPATGADPTADNHLARKAWVLSQIEVAKHGFDIKASVRVATTGNVVLAGGAPNIVDGVSLVAGDRVLVKDQAAGEQNGIYEVQTLGTGANGTWVRAKDADSGDKVTSGLFTSVDQGGQQNSRWVLITDDPVALGTTPLTFARYDAGALQAGAGLKRTADTFDIGAADASIVVGTDNIRVGMDLGGAIEVKAGGIGVKVEGAKALAATSAGLKVVEDAAGGLRVDASGIGVRLDASGSGRLATSANGTRVAAGGAGLPVAWKVEDRRGNEFAPGTGASAGNSVSNTALSSPPSAHANAAENFRLLKGGLDNMVRVTGVPGQPGQWRIDDANKIEIFGTPLADADVYRIRYTADM